MQEMTTDQIWQATLQELQLQMTKATFDTWVKNTRAISYKDGVFIVGAPDAFTKDWLENRLLTTVERIMVGIVGRPVEVQFIVEPEQETPATDSPLTTDEQTEIGLRAVYLSARSAIVQPEKGITVTSYSLEHWLPRLGVHRWTLVQLLRNLCANLPRRPDGTKWLSVTWKDLAAHLEVRADTLSEWLRHEPIPGNHPWRRIVAADEKATWLAMFIPRLRYIYRREGSKTKRVGFLLEIMMEDPLVPEHEKMVNQMVDQQGSVKLLKPDSQSDVKLPQPDSQGGVKLPQPDSQGAVKFPQPDSQDSVKLLQPDSHLCETPQTGENVNVNELTRYIGNIDLRLTSRRLIRRELKPVVTLAERILDDYHSTAMLYKVLLALYPNHLGLFAEAVEEAVAVGREDPEANQGAVFVATLKELAAEAGVELGLGGA